MTKTLIFSVLAVGMMIPSEAVASSWGLIKTTDINKGGIRFSNDAVSAKFDPSTTDLELTFKQDSENMNILIYKNGKVCEKETLPNVSKDDTERYCLSDYGTGVYTICTGENRQVQILGTVVCGE